MYLKNLSLLNFKNYEQVDLSFSEKINCIVGPNGVGKTNLLDAIHYLSLCKSYFNPSDSQNIRYEQDFFVIQGLFIRDKVEEAIYCGFKRNARKQFKRNKADYEKLSDHIGFIPTVIISPYDSRLITEGSEERRKFLDSVISQYDKIYLGNIIRYHKLLDQRNKLLKQINEKSKHDPDLMATIDDQMIPLGESIFEKREEFTKQLIPVFNKFYRYISMGSDEQVGLEYLSRQHETKFRKLLEKSFKKDCILEYTTEGIHKDDLNLTLNGHPIKRVGSQGQQKTLLTALKFAEFDFITQIKGFKPVLLLDDIFDKFDETRVGQIMRLVSEEHFGQIFITDTEETRIERILKSIKVPFNLFVVDKKSTVVLK
jgi:DNA replication and repair protein RecF